MNKNIIITAGGTVEPIDSVRGITNFSSGKFAKIIAEKLLNLGHNVTYVCERSCRYVPMTDTDYTEGAGDLNIINSSGVDGLIEVLKKEVPAHHMIIHMMAVSDYKVMCVNKINFSNVEFNSYNKKYYTHYSSEELNNDGKVSSDLDELLLHLVKTPKVITMVKEWNPVIDLVGFKLLDNASINDRNKAVKKSFDNNKCDYIIYNDMYDIRRGFHPVSIFDENINIIDGRNDYNTEFDNYSKEDSADLIIKTILGE